MRSTWWFWAGVGALGQLFAHYLADDRPDRLVQLPRRAHGFLRTTRPGWGTRVGAGGRRVLGLRGVQRRGDVEQRRGDVLREEHRPHRQRRRSVERGRWQRQQQRRLDREHGPDRDRAGTDAAGVVTAVGDGVDLPVGARVAGSVMVGAGIANKSPITMRNVTPIARLTEDMLAASPLAFAGSTIMLLTCSAGQVTADLADPGGLAGTLLTAGARCVVAPLWPVRLDVATDVAEVTVRLERGRVVS